MTKKTNFAVVGVSKNGKIKHEFLSIEATARGGFNPAAVRRAITSKAPYCGLLWSRDTSVNSPMTGDRHDEYYEALRVKRNFVKLLAGK